MLSECNLSSFEFSVGFFLFEAVTALRELVDGFGVIGLPLTDYPTPTDAISVERPTTSAV